MSIPSDRDATDELFVIAGSILSFGLCSMQNASPGKRSYSQATSLCVNTQSTFKLPHEQRIVRDFPVLRQLSVFNAVELKGHRVDASASGLEATEIALVRTSNGIQDSDAVTLSQNRRNRQR